MYYSTTFSKNQMFIAKNIKKSMLFYEDFVKNFKIAKGNIFYI